MNERRKKIRQELAIKRAEAKRLCEERDARRANRTSFSFTARGGQTIAFEFSGLPVIVEDVNDPSKNLVAQTELLRSQLSKPGEA